MLKHYLVWAWRALIADPWTSLLSLLALSLGLASFALAVAAALFLRSNDISLPDSGRIYAVSEEIVGADGIAMTGALPLTSSPVPRYMEADYPELEAITFLSSNGPLQVVADGKSHQLSPLFFDESFFRVVKLPLRFGRPEQAFSQPRSAVLTAETARRLFGDADPVGRPLRIGTVDVTVAGVLAELAQPSMFRNQFTLKVDLMASRDVRDQVAALMVEPDAWDGYGGVALFKLPEQMSPDRFKARLADFGARHVQRLGRTYQFDLVPLTRFHEALLGGFLGTDKTGLSIPALLFALGGLLLLIAGLNYANLTAAKAISRLSESGMRKVLGAARLELLVQYLIESLVLTIVSLALVVAVLVTIAGPFARLTGIDLRAMLFHRPGFWPLMTGGVAAAILGAGFYPAWLLSGPRAMAAALEGKTRPVRSRMASILVGLQFLTVSFLLIMVGVIALQNDALRRQALPAEGGELLSIDTPLDGTGIGSGDVRNALRDISGVLAVAGSNAPLWSLGSDVRRYFKDAGVSGRAVAGTDFEVTEDYFSVLGTHLLAGRLLSADRGGDLWSDADVPDVSSNVVVDRAFAHAFDWGPEGAVGQNIWHNTLSGGSAPLRIVGVIENRPQLMLANGAAGGVYGLRPDRAVFPLVRLAPGADAEILSRIDFALTRLAPQIDWQLRFSDELFSESAAIFTTITAVLGGLALFAIVIALLGLAGMAAHVLNSRTEEIGIRKILGADHVVILRLLLWDLTRPVLIASLAAWPLGYIAGQVYLALFPGHARLAPWPFIISLAVTLGVAWLAVGWRIAAASTKSPAEVLRHE